MLRAGLRALPAVAILVPVLVLFLQDWRFVGQQVSFATQERHGIAYLQSLVPVETALTDAGSAAVADQSVPRDALVRAVAAHAAVDDRLGSELRTRDRWSELRAKIEALPNRAATSASAVYTAYAEATDLILALFDKVRQNSQLIRDPDADAYYLEDGAAQELAEAVVAAGRYTDLAVMILARPPAEQASMVVDLTSERDSLASNARDLADDVRLAVDNTASRTLGSNLLNRLDRFQRSIDSLIPSTSLLQGRTIAANPAQVARARGETQAAASELSAAILGGIDALLVARLNSLNSERAFAAGALALAILLSLVPLAVGVLRWRRRPGRPVPVEPTAWRGAPDGARSVNGDPARGPRDGPQEWPAPAPPGDPARQPAWSHAMSEEAAGSEPSRWERFGAAR
jgi:hypothetical protein